MEATATDIELLAATAGGDHQAFRILYDRVFDDIERYIASRVDGVHVDDLVADTFLRIYRSAASYQDRGRPVIAWMITIARNVVFSHHRSMAVRRRVVGRADDRTVTTIEELTVDRSDREVVLRSLAELEDRQREILSMRFLDGLTVRACADKLAVSEENVRVMTYRSLKALRRLVQQLEGEDG